MAGISYRGCSFDDEAGALVSAYNSSIALRHLDFTVRVRNTLATMRSTSEQADLSARLTELVKLAGYQDRNELRRQHGLGDDPVTDAEVEVWLLEQTGIAIVNGRYVNQSEGRGSVDLTPYRKAYAFLGFETLDTLLGSGLTHQQYVRSDGVIYTNTPPSMVTDPETLFIWLGPPNGALRSMLRAWGYTGNEIYAIMRGTTSGTVTAVVLTRTDLFSRLRSMGWDNTAIETLLQRDGIERILIDTQENRADDTQSSVPGVWRATPYPGEQLRAYRRQISNIPRSGSARTEHGAVRYGSVHLRLGRVLDWQLSFGLPEFVDAASDTVSPTDQRSQGVLSAARTHSENQGGSQGFLMRELDSVVSGVTSLLEDVRSFFGIDSDCGRATNNRTSTVSKIELSDLAPEFDLKVSSFKSFWKAGVGPMSNKTGLGQALLNQADNLLCNAASLACLYKNVGNPITDGNDTSFDAPGVVDMALADVDEMYEAMGNSIRKAFSDTVGIAGALRNAANILTAREDDCESSDTLGYISSMETSIRRGEQPTSVLDITTNTQANASTR